MVVAAAMAVAVGGVSFCWRLALPLWWVSQVLRCFKFRFFGGLIHIHFCKTCMVVLSFIFFLFQICFLKFFYVSCVLLLVL